jgi:hypothetical protein
LVVNFSENRDILTGLGGDAFATSFFGGEGRSGLPALGSSAPGGQPVLPPADFECLGSISRTQIRLR